MLIKYLVFLFYFFGDVFGVYFRKLPEIIFPYFSFARITEEKFDVFPVKTLQKNKYGKIFFRFMFF